jgi:hypothetical protein
MDLPENHTGRCPKCGSEKQSIFVSVGNKIGLSQSVGWQSRREFYEKNPKVAAVVWFIAIVAPFAGYFGGDGWGVVVGLLCSALTLYLGPIVSTKVRDVRHG